MFKGLDSIAILSLLGWGLGYFGQPHILARFHGGRLPSHYQECAPHQHDLDDPLSDGNYRYRLLRHCIFSNNPAVAGNVDHNSERVFIELAKILFNPWIAGVLLSAIMAAVMSTLSCQLLVSSSAITEDLYKAFLRKGASQKELVWVGRVMVLIGGGGGYLPGFRSD